jgi:hypothetical protein
VRCSLISSFYQDFIKVCVPDPDEYTLICFNTPRIFLLGTWYLCLFLQISAPNYTLINNYLFSPVFVIIIIIHLFLQQILAEVFAFVTDLKVCESIKFFIFFISYTNFIVYFGFIKHCSYIVTYLFYGIFFIYKTTRYLLLYIYRIRYIIWLLLLFLLIILLFFNYSYYFLLILLLFRLPSLLNYYNIKSKSLTKYFNSYFTRYS